MHLVCYCDINTAMWYRYLCYKCGRNNFCYSEEQAKLAARKYARIVQKLGFPVCYLASFILKMITVSC